MLIENSYQVGVEFKPWTDKGYMVTRLQLVEQLGGIMPRGEIDMFLANTDESIKLVTEENTGTIDIITKEDVGISYKDIKVYITNRSYFGNILNIKFIVTDDIKFLTERITTYYPKDMELYKKIQSTFPGKSEGIDPKANIRMDYDVPDIILYQNNETNYEFNKRLCSSYKKNSIFAYGWEGLLIKDTEGDANHLGNHEPDENMQIESSRLIFQSDFYNLRYNKRMNHEPYDPWVAPDDSTTKTDYSEVESKYLRTTMNYKEYKVVGKDLEPYLMNSWYNERFLDNGGFTYFDVSLTSIPNFKLGDVLIYKRAEQESQEQKIPWTKYLVTSNEVFFAIDATNLVSKEGLKFSWTSKLLGLEDGKWNERTDP